jgi:RNA polymerase-binding transcription factor DksA
VPLASHTTASVEPGGRPAVDGVSVDLDPARDRLLAERSELLRTLEDVADDTTQPPSDVPDGIGETEHLARAEQTDVSTRVGALARHALDDLDAALARLRDGTYGRCTGCGGTIPAERLEAVPAAACCVGCQSSREGLLR